MTTPMKFPCVAVSVLSFDDARRLTDRIKTNAAALWADLVLAYDGGAHIALGYASWGAYYEEEFGQSSRHGYRLLDAGRALDVLSDQLVIPTNESVARELAPLLSEPEQLRDAWQEVVATHGPTPTAAEVRGVVDAKVHNHRAQGRGENEWYTPTKYLDLARQMLGAIDLDPASRG